MHDRFGDVRGQRKVGALAYALAALSIVPIIGVLLGAMSITWGVNTRKARGKRLAAFAALGVAVSVAATVVLYRESGAIGLMRWLERHDTFDLIRAGVARSALDRQRLFADIAELELQAGDILAANAAIEDLAHNVADAHGGVAVHLLRAKLHERMGETAQAKWERDQAEKLR